LSENSPGAIIARSVSFGKAQGWFCRRSIFFYMTGFFVPQKAWDSEWQYILTKSW